MAKYRKKPVTIDAIQYQGNYPEIDEWLSQWHGEDDGPGMWADRYEGKACLMIETLEGIMRADWNDWIIRGVQGEYYPCKPDIFDKTYDKVEEG